MIFLALSCPTLLSSQTLCDQYGDLPPDITIGTGYNSITFASTIPAPPYPGWVNKNILIQGTLIADVSLFFNNCTVKMGPAASIQTQGDVDIAIRSSRFFSCGQMWRGIMLQQGSAFRIEKTRIEDAQYAFTIDDGVSGVLTETTFNRNYVGIRNNNAVGGQSGLSFFHFGLNQFTCSVPLNASFPGQSPDPGGISFAGIQLDQCTATIGIPKYGMNAFSRLRYGIYAEKSSLTVRACRFEFMQDVDPGGGRGIYVVDGSLLVDAPLVGQSRPNPCVFYGNSAAGVEGIGSGLNINYATFSGPQFMGICSSENLAGEMIQCTSDTFKLNSSACLAAICIDRSVASGIYPHTNISSNLITLSATSPLGLYGIFVTGTFPAIDKVGIIRNTVEAISFGLDMYAIQAVGWTTDGFKIYSNRVIFANGPTTNSERWGISMLDSWGFFHEISENSILGYGSNVPGQCAIHIDEARNLEVCHNTLDHTRRGFHLVGNDNPCYLRNNVINHHHEGILLTDHYYPGDGIIDHQVRHGNVWLDESGAYVNWAAQCAANPNNSLFIVESVDPTIFPSQISPATGWFSYEEGPLNYCLDTILPEIPWTALDQRIAEGTFFDSTSTPLQVWSMEKDLYFKLLRFPELIAPGSDAETFFNYTVNPSSAAYASTEYELWKALLIGTGLQAQLDQISQDKEELLYQLMALDDLASPEDSLQFDTALYAQKALLLDSLQIMAENWQSLREQQENIRLSNLQPVEILIGQLPADSTFEAYQLYDLQLTVQAAKGIPFTPAQLGQMEVIAETCPDVGGPAVRGIIRWLPQSMHAAYLSDEPPTCLRERSPGSGKSERPPVGTLSVTPNPANEQIELRWEAGASARLLLFNATGQLLREFAFSPGQQFMEMDIRDFPPGIYFLALEQNGEITNRSSVSIQH